MSNDLKLIHSLPASAEKQLESHKKNIRLYALGVARSGAQMFGYAFLAGNEMNEAAKLLPHGEVEKWIESNFPEIPRPTAFRYRQFADLVGPKLVETKSLTVRLLTPKKKFNEKECTALSTVVREAMDGKGMLEFMREAKFLREIEDAGGFRPNAAKLVQWLRANQLEKAVEDFLAKSEKSDMSEISFDDLPPKLQMQFKKWLASQTIKEKPNKKIELARTLLTDLNKQLVLAQRNKVAMHAGTQELSAEFEAAALNLEKLNAEFQQCVKTAKNK